MRKAATKQKSDRTAEDKRREEREKRLDQGLKESFPASDPLAAGAPTGTEPLPPLVSRKKK
jgi:hypothetical protein